MSVPLSLIHRGYRVTETLTLIHRECRLTETLTLIHRECRLTETLTLTHRGYRWTETLSLIHRGYRVTETFTLIHRVYRVTETFTLIHRVYRVTETFTLIQTDRQAKFIYIQWAPENYGIWTRHQTNLMCFDIFICCRSAPSKTSYLEKRTWKIDLYFKIYPFDKTHNSLKN